MSPVVFNVFKRLDVRGARTEGGYNTIRDAHVDWAMAEAVLEARKEADVKVLIGGACSSANTRDKLFCDGTDKNRTLFRSIGLTKDARLELSDGGGQFVLLDFYGNPVPSKDNPLSFHNDWSTHWANEVEFGFER